VDDLLQRLKTIFVDSYAIDEELSGGGMSRLFRATDLTLNRQIVIKILPPELTSDVMAARFKRESEVTAHLQHPHILPIITAGLKDGLMYYVMPFIAGESLRGRLKREGPLGPDLSVSVLREVASALAYAHKQGVIHRDIKPENILLQEDHAVLADFGIAAALAGPSQLSGERLTRTGISLGTVGYMAPEQSLGGENIDSRADIYSLGVVGHEMIAGAPPFAGNTTQAIIAAHLTQKPPRLDDLSDDVPVTVARAIQKAMAKDPGDRFQTAGEFRDALDASTPRLSTLSRAVSPRRLRRKLQKFIVPAAAALGLIGVGVWALLHRSPAAVEQPVSIVIAPFDALVPDTSELKLWHEGMVDLMARNLDGAGPLRTVSPSTSIRGWKGLSDHQSALALARRTNARYAIFGNLGGSGIDSVRIRATLLDASNDKIVNEYEPRGADVDKAASALTIAILKDLQGRHRIGAVRQTSVGSTSLPALKAFLQGEQYFRRTSWDSAGVAYTRAISLDNTFALALRRAAQVTGWQKSGSDSLANAYWLRAGARNRGLGPRDSLLIAADSLTAALQQTDLTNPEWTKLRRLFSTVNELSRRYPTDAEAWYALGEAEMHYGYGSIFDISEAQILKAFDRAIAIDSAFAPAYIHTVELGFVLGGATMGRRYIHAYLAHYPAGKDGEAVSLLDRITDPAESGSRSVQMMLDTSSTTVLIHAWAPVNRWADSAETALRLLRAIARRPRSSPSYRQDSAWLADALPLQLAFRGRMHEASSLLGNRPSRLFAQLAMMGVVAHDSAQAVFNSWLTSGNSQLHTALPWWASSGDTASIGRLAALYETRLSNAPASQRNLAAYNLAAARGYLFLARRDSASAEKIFATLADTVCLRCDFDRLESARLHAARGKTDVADKLLRQRLYSSVTPAEITIAFARAQIADRAGHKELARKAATLVVSAWKEGDPELQSMVFAAKRLIQ